MFNLDSTESVTKWTYINWSDPTHDPVAQRWINIIEFFVRKLNDRQLKEEKEKSFQEEKQEEKLNIKK